MFKKVGLVLLAFIKKDERALKFKLLLMLHRYPLKNFYKKVNVYLSRYKG